MTGCWNFINKFKIWLGKIQTVLTESDGLAAASWSAITIMTPRMIPTPAPSHGIWSSAVNVNKILAV
jgi:hypothetical protein